KLLRPTAHLPSNERIGAGSVPASAGPFSIRHRRENVRSAGNDERQRAEKPTKLSCPSVRATHVHTLVRCASAGTAATDGTDRAFSTIGIGWTAVSNWRQRSAVREHRRHARLRLGVP